MLRHDDHPLSTKSLSDGADAERLALESKHAKRVARVLRAQLREILPQNVSPDIAAHAVTRLQMLRKPLHSALYAMLLEGTRLGTDHGRGQVDALLGVSTKTLDDASWDLVNEDARMWASMYAGQLVDGITATSTTLLQGALSDYISGTITYRDLIAHLAPTFGSRRAETISQTEITRAFAEGNRAAWQRTGVIQWWSWQTANDERTCPYCSPKQGEVYPMAAEMPPAHPRCRCWTAPSVDGPDNG